MATNKYIVAGCKPWSRRVFDEVLSGYPGTWYFIDQPGELIADTVSDLSPRYIFFLHWSWKVPPGVFNNCECICFHMTDVPYGRGGSPLQNLIMRGHRQTKLSALRMVEEFDGGPVYLKEDLSLEGSAEEIFVRASSLAAKMILRIIKDQPEPQPQTEPPTIFKRREAQESRILQLSSLDSLHDFIRMLDAEGYPRAFFEYAGFHFEFSRSTLYSGKIVADVEITPIEKESAA